MGGLGNTGHVRTNYNSRKQDAVNLQKITWGGLETPIKRAEVEPLTRRALKDISYTGDLYRIFVGHPRRSNGTKESRG